MAGIVKRKYNKEITMIHKQIGKEVESLIVVLPIKFNISDIVAAYKEYFPFQYFVWNDMNNTYIQKNKFLASVHKRKRYKEYNTFEDFLKENQKVKWLLSQSRNGKILQATEQEKERFINKRKARIQEKEKCIQNYKLSLGGGILPFEIDPLCLTYLIRYYHEKADAIGKARIVDFLMKYTGDTTIQFFKKINDCENNHSIRRKAFEHLQQLGYYVKLRKKTSKSEKEYATISFDLERESLNDLYENINKIDSFEKNKQFHFFISHNQLDKQYANEMVKLLNSKGYDCYFCWISDKKEGISEHLGEILDLRIKQSVAIIKIKSENHDNSEWCQFEIKKADLNKKPIFVYNVGEDIEKFISEKLNLNK